MTTCLRFCQCVTPKTVQKTDTLVLDNLWLIIGEYKKKVSPSGQPGVGDAFLKWVLTNRSNPQRCEQVSITQISENEFAEFPKSEALEKFDRSDRKFVAVALAHPHHPPITNAVDSDWRDFQDALAEYGVQIEFLCP
ncbi:MAG: hypothetical protein VKJ46_11845 [Leptolyngbyaceae bacterium]|nr:hypothetical protein [Leptolyngbyaceae bacterium]